MITHVMIQAFARPGGALTVRVSYADESVDGIAPPLRFWRSSTSSGQVMDNGIREAVFWVMEAVADINYGDSDFGEVDPFGDAQSRFLPAPWIEVDPEELP